MKYLLILLVLILTLSCVKNNHSLQYFGTWSKCNSHGEYFEWQIGKDYVIMLGLFKNGTKIIQSKNDHNYIILHNVDYEPHIDTFDLVSISENKLVLHRKFMNQIIELDRVDNYEYKIDSTNLENWSKETLLNFQERAVSKKCPFIKSRDSLLQDFGEVSKKVEYVEISLGGLIDSIE